MEQRDENSMAADDLWDPEARRRAFLALSLSERLALVAVVSRDQAAVFDRMAIIR